MAKASDVAYASVRSDILAWILPPGAPLAEVELSTRLGISRTPVREALARLVAEGLVDPVGGRGLVVAPLSTRSIELLFEVRVPLEQEAASLASRRRDRQAFVSIRDALLEVPALLAEADPSRQHYYDLVARFDAAVDEAVGNPFLASSLDNVRTRLARARRMSQDRPQRLLEAAREHLLIVEAIIDSDARLAADATRIHLHRSLDSILSTTDTGAERDATTRSTTRGRKSA